MAYFVQIKKNGCIYGTIGPYADRASALVDAVALKRPDHEVSVTGTKRNSPAALALLAPYLIEMVSKLAAAQIKKYQSLSEPDQIVFLRRKTRGNIPLTLALRNEKSAIAINRMVASFVQSGDVEGLIATLGTAVSEPSSGAGPAPVRPNGKLSLSALLPKGTREVQGALTQAVQTRGYRSVLGSLSAWNRDDRITPNQRGKIRAWRDWLIDKHGGPGAFGWPR